MNLPGKNRIVDLERKLLLRDNWSGYSIYRYQYYSTAFFIRVDGDESLFRFSWSVDSLYRDPGNIKAFGTLGEAIQFYAGRLLRSPNAIDWVEELADGSIVTNRVVKTPYECLCKDRSWGIRRLRRGNRVTYLHELSGERFFTSDDISSYPASKYYSSSLDAIYHSYLFN